MTRPLRVGLTGGIATGKSYVRAALARRGVPTIDADVVAREVVAPGTPGLAAITARFGPAVLQPDGHLDRQALGRVVFADATARRDLEAIVHPAVYVAITRWFERLEDAGGDELAVADIPLLFETGRAGDFDAVVVTACEPATQLARLRSRDGTTEQDARHRIAAQWPPEEKVRRADHVIRTDGSFAETEARVAAVHEALLALGRAGQRPA